MARKSASPSVEPAPEPAEELPPEVSCRECGNVQADMGRGVACEACGVTVTVEAGGRSAAFGTPEAAEIVADVVRNALEEAVASGEAEAAQPALEGTGVEPIVTAAGDLWDPVDGHRIREIGLGVSGSLGLFAGNAYHRDLAEKLTRNGSEFALTLRGTVESTGHKVDRYKGAMVGLSGVAKFKISGLVEVEEYYEELGELRDRFDAGLEALDDLLADVRDEGRGSTTDPRIPARGMIKALAQLRAMFLGIPLAVMEPEAAAFEPPRRQSLRELIAAAEAEPLPDPLALCLCGHMRNAHAGHENEGACDAERAIMMGDGELRREGCSCAEFREAPTALEDRCANCDHGEHADGSPGCEVEVRRQQFTLDRELADVWGACGCKYWQPRAVATYEGQFGGSDSSPSDEGPESEPAGDFQARALDPSEVETFREQWEGQYTGLEHAHEVVRLDAAPDELVAGRCRKCNATVAPGDPDLCERCDLHEETTSPLVRDLSASIELAEALAAGRPALRPVANEAQRCGQIHAGHLAPCPFDVFECDLPPVLAAEEVAP